LFLNGIDSCSGIFEYEVKYSYLLIVSLQDLGSQNSVGFDLHGEDVTISWYILKFDGYYLFLTVVAVDYVLHLLIQS
jgi:hypothetical protein